ncbi:MAG: nucleoside-diphosphate sugar epimerase/dehydratase [Vicinamibacterales bacterium]
MRNRYVFVADLVAIALCVLGAFVLRLDWFFTGQPEYVAAFRYFLAAAFLVKPAVFYVFGLYRRFWRYAGTRDLSVVFLAVSAASTLLAVVVAQGVIGRFVPFFPRSVLAIDWLLTMACVAGIRLSIRVVGESLSRGAPASGPPAGETRKVLVAGAGDAGELVVREMQKNPQLGMRPIGYLDDQRQKRGKRIHGIPVLGALADLESIVHREGVDQVVIAMPTADGAVIRDVIDAGRRADVQVRSVPGVFELLDGGVAVNRLREVDIADLLRRRPIRAQSVAGLYLGGKTVLVTGAGGSIGSELCRQVTRAGASRLVLVGHGENSIFDAANRLRDLYPAAELHAVIADVRDAGRMDAVFSRFAPDVVFHAAAHKHVPLMESDPEEAVTNNVLGTQVVVDAAIRHGVDRFVLISTDKAVAPTSIMGASKRVAEAIVRRAAVRHRKAYVAVRFGNVLGSRGSVVPFFKSQIARGGPLTLTHPEMRRFFMTIPEAVYLVVKAGGLAAGGELFVLNMGEPVRIVDLAGDLIRLSGLTPGSIPIAYTGLRPGEKLEEVLWEADSETTPIGDGEVLRVVERASMADDAALDALLAGLTRAAAAGDGAAIHRILGRWLPTFVSGLGAAAGPDPAPVRIH